MLIYIKTENIFFDNVNCCESIYDFFYAHQNYKKKIGYKIYLQRRVWRVRSRLFDGDKGSRERSVWYANKQELKIFILSLNIK